MPDLTQMAETLMVSLEALVAKRCEPLQKRIAELEARAPVAGEQGIPGVDGKSVVVEDVRPLIAELVKTAVDAIPVPKDGRDGTNGENGAPGASVDAATVSAMVAAEVSKGLALIPKVIDGRDGLPGIPGRDGKDGTAGVNGKDGAAGAKGADGLGAEDIALELGEDLRTLTVRLMRAGEVVKSSSVIVPWPIDRGVWKPELDFAKGDGVSYNGSLWIAQAETKDRPGTSSAWRLAVKAGRDGKDMRPNGTIDRAPVRLTD